MNTKQQSGESLSSGVAASTAPARWLRDLAAHHERCGEPVWALLYRNDAARSEEACNFPSQDTDHESRATEAL